MVSLTAIKTHKYGTRYMKPGDEYEARDNEARLLVAIGKSKPTPQKQAVQPAAQKTREDTAGKARAPKTEAEKVFSSADKPKRQYQRRDMKAED